MFDIKILETPLLTASCINFAADENTGAINVFIGTVRNNTKGKRVLRLEYEAYVPLAILEIQKILQRAKEKFKVEKIAVHHRIGTLEIGEAAIIIAVSAPHREAGFDACEFIIDTVKETVPIWKKEIFEDGEIWVAAHP
jgi:molybdopterin synthase catalytic subunit